MRNYTAHISVLIAALLSGCGDPVTVQDSLPTPSASVPTPTSESEAPSAGTEVTPPAAPPTVSQQLRIQLPAALSGDWLEFDVDQGRATLRSVPGELVGKIELRGQRGLNWIGEGLDKACVNIEGWIDSSEQMERVGATAAAQAFRDRVRKQSVAILDIPGYAIAGNSSFLNRALSAAGLTLASPFNLYARRVRVLYQSNSLYKRLGSDERLAENLEAQIPVKSLGYNDRIRIETPTLDLVCDLYHGRAAIDVEVWGRIDSEIHLGFLSLRSIVYGGPQ